jgi:hypothetical protein
MHHFNLCLDIFALVDRALLTMGSEAIAAAIRSVGFTGHIVVPINAMGVGLCRIGHKISLKVPYCTKDCGLTPAK